MKVKAVIGAFNEGDVIADCVRNAFAQGADEVYLLDNMSPDDTRGQAVCAGAIVEEVYSTAQYDEELRVEKMNRVVARHSEPGQVTWWMFLDADELPIGRGGESVRDMIESAPANIEAFGCDRIDMFPGEGGGYVQGIDPRDSFKLAERFFDRKLHHCRYRHWKHQIFRRTDDRKLLAGVGCHVLRPSNYAEQERTIDVLHVPWRDETLTRKRLSDLVGSGRNFSNNLRCGGSALNHRWKTLDLLYGGQWKELKRRPKPVGEVLAEKE